MSKESNTSNGIGFGGALFLVFLVLKLTGVIDWSWWWITAPLWLPIAIVIGILAVAGTIAIKEHTRQSKAFKSRWEERMEKIKERQKEWEKTRSN